MTTSESDTERFCVNERLKGAIGKHFKDRVDPLLLNDALSHKVRLTTKQEDEMRAKMDNGGRWKACDYLFTQLVKKTDWFKYLLRALADPHVCMEDFAEFCKQKEAEIKRHSGETTTDGEETGYLKLLDEPDGIGGSRIPRAPLHQSSPNEDVDEDIYEDFGTADDYDDAISLPADKRRSRRPRGNGHGRTQQRTIQHGKAAVSSLQNKNYYSTVYDHMAYHPASSPARYQDSLGATRGEVPPPRVLQTALEQYDDDGYTQILSSSSASLVRPEISSRSSHRSSHHHKETVADTHPHVARYQNVPEGQALKKTCTSRGKSDDAERTRLSAIYSPDTWGSSARSGFRPPVVSVPQPSPDYYNPYVRKAAEDARTLVSRDADAHDINHPSENSDNFLLRPASSSKKDVLLRSREKGCRGDGRTRHEDVNSKSHSGERKQRASQYGAPPTQLKAYSDLDRRESSRGLAAGGDFTRAEVDTELTNFPGYTPNITDDEVRNRMQRCKDNTYIVWYSESEQRPALGVVYNYTFMTFTIKKRPSFSGTKFYVDQNQKDGYSLTELLKYHVDAGIKDTRPSSYRQKIMLKYPFLE
ncbi:uncharacterized protein [Haliotis asinina]|uniref:uncharacterized protein n=1 Tax=Haliotis asinina TaxID=109174 RepID=UPI003531EDB5